MRSLYLRVWLTVVAVLALFALGSGWMFRHQMERERERVDELVQERLEAWGELMQRSLPPAAAPRDEQASSLREWSQRLRVPMALDDAEGKSIGAAEAYERRDDRDGREDRDGRDGRDERSSRLRGRYPHSMAVPLDDGRTLWIMRPSLAPMIGPRHGRDGPPHGPDGRRPAPGTLMLAPPWWAGGTKLLAVLALLFVAVAAGAYPVVRRLTRRLEALQRGVERFGGGALHHRVDATGNDEVAAVAASFNRAAERVEALLRSNQSLLANASHELRSPLARMKMAVTMLDGADEPQRVRLRREIDTNIAELDALVEEVLLASRLDAQSQEQARDDVDLQAVVAEEAARTGALVGDAAAAGVVVRGDERLLRRAVRNLLENGRRYGGGDVTVQLARAGAEVELRVCDRGPGVPAEMRERIFEPFFRLPGHAEREGGVGLGLSLVRQIAERHGGRVRCEAHDGGGSCFVLSLPGS